MRRPTVPAVLAACAAAVIAWTGAAGAATAAPTAPATHPPCERRRSREAAATPVPARRASRTATPSRTDAAAKAVQPNALPAGRADLQSAYKLPGLAAGARQQGTPLRVDAVTRR